MQTKEHSGYGKPEIRFWRKVDKNGPVHPVCGQCWIWIGSKFKGNGYGQFSVFEQPQRAHRFSWELHNGKIKDGAKVLHRCDNRLCVNPEHLFLGTDADNIKRLSWQHVE